MTEAQAGQDGLLLQLTAAEAQANRLSGASGFPRRLLVPAPTADVIREMGYDPTTSFVHDDLEALQGVDAAALRQMLAAARWQLAASRAHAQRAEARIQALQAEDLRSKGQAAATRVRRRGVGFGACHRSAWHGWTKCLLPNPKSLLCPFIASFASFFASPLASFFTAALALTPLIRPTSCHILQAQLQSQLDAAQAGQSIALDRVSSLLVSSSCRFWSSVSLHRSAPPVNPNPRFTPFIHPHVSKADAARHQSRRLC